MNTTEKMIWLYKNCSEEFESDNIQKMINEMKEKLFSVMYWIVIPEYIRELKWLKFKEKVFLLFSTIKEYDENTAEHCERVWVFTRLLIDLDSHKSIELLDENVLDLIPIIAKLHDLWKIVINKDILLKKWKLNLHEFTEIKRHSYILKEFIEELFKWEKYCELLVDCMVWHHEKFNGIWYPDWKKWDFIAYIARVTAIADVFDAITSKRVYHEAETEDKTFFIMKEEMKWHFDPRLFGIFKENYKIFCEVHEKLIIIQKNKNNF